MGLQLFAALNSTIHGTDRTLDSVSATLSKRSPDEVPVYLRRSISVKIYRWLSQRHWMNRQSGFMWIDAAYSITQVGNVPPLIDLAT